MLDTLYEWMFLGGLAGAAVAWLWMLTIAFRTSRGWGVLVLLIPPTVLLFAAQHWSRAKAPLGAVLASLLIAAAPAIYTRVAPIDLGPRVSEVDGQQHITLTGWDQTSYSVLRQYPNVNVLQMANADVSDSTLNVLKGALKLKELDISGSLVTDAGLAVIATLPALEVLRIANCRITDAGFRDHLLNHPALLRIDVTGTAVSPELIREWRRANPERRAMQ